MARSHARISVAVWSDDDFADLPPMAQWLYAFLLAHPKLTLCGVLDVHPRRWARLSRHVTEDAVEAALVDLEANGYVLVDHDEGEMMFRTFVTHDLAPGRMNRNLAVGFWRAYDGIMSADLRAALLGAIPNDLWDKLADHAPSGAASFRRSLRLEQASEPSVPNVQSGGSVATPLSPKPETLNPDPSSSQSDSRVPVDNGTDALREPMLRAVPGGIWPGGAA